LVKPTNPWPQYETPQQQNRRPPQQQTNATPQADDNETPQPQEPEKSEAVKQIRQKALLRSAAQNDLSVLIDKRQNINKEAAQLKRQAAQVKRRQQAINAAIEAKLTIVTKLDKEYENGLAKINIEEL
jgi:parvulin-like peptidyl-prolyl isomerase